MAKDSSKSSTKSNCGKGSRCPDGEKKKKMVVLSAKRETKEPEEDCLGASKTLALPHDGTEKVATRLRSWTVTFGVN